MENAVYVNLSVVDLKPNVLNFLSTLAETAKESVFVTRVKDLAEQLGKDVRTIQRHLKELAEKDILEMKGRRGKAGGTVIRFNSDLVQFTTSDKALINSEEPIDIDELLQTKIPKKKQEPNPNKRPRRTKSQMIEAQLLQDEKQAKIDELNGRLQILGGVPNWDWFQLTDNPVGNYRTYLLTRLYNRYAKLFTDIENATLATYGEEKRLPEVSSNYDVLGHGKVLGTSRWDAFSKLHTFCEENNINPFNYLSSQFARSFYSAVNGKSKPLPFVNALIGDTSYNVYVQYVQHYKKVAKGSLSFSTAPTKFAGDLVIRALEEAYITAEKSTGFFQYKPAIKEFLKGNYGYEDKQEALATYYITTSQKLRELGISTKHRDVLKKFILTQAMIQTKGARALPKHVILGAEHTRLALLPMQDEEMKYYALACLVNGQDTSFNEETKNEGWKYNYQLNLMDDTRQVLTLTQEQQGIHISSRELQEALAQLDETLIPLDDYSMLDVGQIVQVTETQSTQQEIDFEEITYNEFKAMSGTVVTDNPYNDLLKGLKLQ